jgi:molecular chaperone GrpE
MSDRRLVWATLADLITRLEKAVTPLIAGSEDDEQPSTAVSPDITALEQEVRKLGRTQFKANALAEEQNTRIEQVLTKLESEETQRAELLETLVADRVADAHLTWIRALFPVLDGLDHAINSGQRYLAKAEGETRVQLTGWLKGIRLVRERLLASLKAEGVTPIPTVGRPFDPYLHIAVSTTKQAQNGMAPGTIVAEERRGYRTKEDILRFADVIVYRP